MDLMVCEGLGHRSDGVLGGQHPYQHFRVRKLYVSGPESFSGTYPHFGGTPLNLQR